MTAPRRGVTRGYVGGLLLATLIVAAALVVATWGFLSLFSEGAPVVTDGVPKWVAPVAILLALAALGWGLWQQAILLLKGRQAPSWAHVVVLAGAAYLIWCIVGVLGGLTINETWLSPFALSLAPIWAVTSFLFWAVLMRRVYTDRGVPKWPWERRAEREEGNGEEG